MEKELDEKMQELRDFKVKLSAAQTERTELAKDEIRYQNLLLEMENLRGKNEGKLLLKERLEKTLNKHLQEKASLDIQAKNYLVKKKQISETLKASKSVETLEAALEASEMKRSKINADIDIKQTAISMAERGIQSCPVCSNPLTEQDIASWKNDVILMKSLYTVVAGDFNKTKEALTSLKDLKVQLEQLDEDMGDNVDDLADTKKEITEAEKEISILKGVLATVEVRTAAIKKELVEFENLITTLNEFDAKLSAMMKKQGILTEAVSGIKMRRDKSLENIDKNACVQGRSRFVLTVCYPCQAFTKSETGYRKAFNQDLPVFHGGGYKDRRRGRREAGS